VARTDGQTDRQTDGRTDGRTDGGDNHNITTFFSKSVGIKSGGSKMNKNVMLGTVSYIVDLFMCIVVFVASKVVVNMEVCNVKCCSGKL